MVNVLKLDFTGRNILYKRWKLNVNNLLFKKCLHFFNLHGLMID